MAGRTRFGRSWEKIASTYPKRITFYLFAILFTYLRTAYYLNFLVVVGAILSNRMAARLSDVAPIHWATPWVLGLSVFIIYTVDRLLDVRKAENATLASALPKRHLFHQKHATLLWKVVAAATLLAIGLTFFLPPAVVKFGIILAGFCAAYVGAVFRLPEKHPALLLKEPLVAFLYTAGVWGSVWAQRATINRIDSIEAVMFLLIAFQNLLLFALMEEYETEGGTTFHTFSLATEWGEARSRVIFRWLMFGVVILGVVVCFLTDDRFAQRSALMLGFMSLTLYAILHYANFFLVNERYRWLGDGVFWMPALVL